MYNVLLVVKDNLVRLEKIINIISLEKSFLRVLNIASTCNLAINFLIKCDYDIIIVDIKSLCGILNFIEDKNLYQYKKSIIVLQDNQFYNIQNSIFLFGSINILDELKYLLREIINYKNEVGSIREKIQNELRYLCYNYSYIGTKYIEEVIFEIYKIKECFNGNLAREIYPILSKRYNKSVDSIYGDIKLSTRNMILDCSEDIIMEYFNYSYFVMPKIKEIILVILNKL